MFNKLYKILFLIMAVTAFVGVCRLVISAENDNSSCPSGYHIETYLIDWCVVDKK